MSDLRVSLPSQKPGRRAGLCAHQRVRVSQGSEHRRQEPLVDRELHITPVDGPQRPCADARIRISQRLVQSLKNEVSRLASHCDGPDCRATDISLRVVNIRNHCSAHLLLSFSHRRQL